MKAAVPLAAIVLTGIAGCSSHTTKASPAKTASSAAAPTLMALSASDKAYAQISCFGWTTYDKAVTAGEGRPTLTKYAVTAQRSTATMTDPRWSAVARMPATEAMRTLGDLCRGIGYKEPAG